MPDNVDSINDQIVTNALGPKRVRVGDEDVEQRDSDDLIKARNDQAAVNASTKPHFGLRFSHFTPHGGGG